MSVEKVAAVHYRRQVALADETARAAAKLWSLVDVGNVAASWASLAGRLLQVVGVSQATAAAGANVYLADIADQYGLRSGPTTRVAAQSFAGIASDGRALGSLLYQPAVGTLAAIGSGVDQRRALGVGGTALDMIVRTQVADAGRVADGVAIAADKRLTGYVRMLSGKSCGRCVILAGKFYRWNAGFRRHPRCDCRHIPAAEDAHGDRRTNPRAHFDSLSAADQDRAFGKAGAEAIRQGADMNRVVNANRGTYVAGGRKFTTDSTTAAGTGRRVRLMPESIFAEAGGNRDEAIRLLRAHGFIV